MTGYRASLIYMPSLK